MEDLWEDFAIVDSDQEDHQIQPYLIPPSDGSCWIDELPADLMRLVFSVLPLDDHGFIVPHVSKRWRSLSQLKMGHKSPPSSILLLQNNSYIVTVQPNTVLLWDLKEERAIQKMRCTTNLSIGLGGIIEIPKSQLNIHKPLEGTQSFHFPHDVCLCLKDGSLLGISSNSRTRYTLDPYTEYETVLEKEPPTKNITAGVFSNEEYGYCRSPQYLIIFRTKDLKRVACVDLLFYGVAAKYSKPIEVSKDGHSLSVQDNGKVAIFRRPKPSAHLPEKIACQMWSLHKSISSHIESIKWDENLTIGLMKKETNLILVGEKLNTLHVFQNYSEYCWTSPDSFYIANKTQLELYKTEKEGLTFKPVLLQTIQSIDTEHICSITKLSSKYFATVNGYNNVIVWDNDTLTTKYRLTGNIIQGGNLVKLEDDFFAVSCQDHIIVHKIGRFGSTHVYSIPNTKTVYKIGSRGGKGYALTSNCVIVWEVFSGKILTTYNLSPYNDQHFRYARFWFFPDGTLSISFHSTVLFINENWSKGQFQINEEDHECSDQNVHDNYKWQQNEEGILIYSESHNHIIFLVLYGEKLFFVHSYKTRVFNWKTLRLESSIDSNNYHIYPQQFQQIGHVATYIQYGDYIQFDLLRGTSSNMISSCSDTYQQIGYLLSHPTINTVDLKHWSICESFNISKLKVGHAKHMFVLYDDFVVVTRSNKVASFCMKENSYVKTELVGVAVRYRSQVCVSDNRKMIAIQTPTGLHIGMLCTHPVQPFLSWRFIALASEVTENATLFFNSQHNTFVVLGKSSIYTFYTDQEVGFSTLALL